MKINLGMQNIHYGVGLYPLLTVTCVMHTTVNASLI